MFTNDYILKFIMFSAGKIDPDFNIESWEEECSRKKPPPRFIVEAFSRYG